VLEQILWNRKNHANNYVTRIDSIMLSKHSTPFSRTKKIPMNLVN